MDSEQQPNLLMIVLDQLRFDCLGMTSDGKVRTPNIDRLAQQGVAFNNAFNHLPTCCPSRQSFLNGQRPEAFGAHWNYDIALPISSLSPSDPTWTSALSAAGYRSVYHGKWHVSPEHTPIDFGYDEYISQDDYGAYRDARYPNLPVLPGWEAGIDPVALEDAETHWFATKTSNRLRELAASESPWHMRLDLVQPHLPCRPVAQFADLYDPATIEPWSSFGETFKDKPYIQRQQLASWGVEEWTWKEWSEIVARYFGLITQVDDAIGLVLRTLEEVGQTEQTIVVLTTDHGDMCGSHRMMDKHYVLYDDVIRVPLIISWPGQFPAGGERTQLVYNVLDLAPTITDLLALPPLEAAVGTTLVPLLAEDGDTVPWRDCVVSTYNGQQFGLYTQRSIRTYRWKYVWNAVDVDELYDLESDPAELWNLIQDGTRADLLADLRRRLYATLLDEGDRQVDNAWVRRQLLDGFIVVDR